MASDPILQNDDNQLELKKSKNAETKDAKNLNNSNGIDFDKNNNQETDVDKSKIDQEYIFVHDTSFSVKISAPGIDTFDLQVSSMELVQEIHQLLMDREDTCTRTCFSLSLNGNTLDIFAELKNIEGFKEGAIIKVVEEPYTTREARIHVRHIRDLLKSLDPADAYNGQDCDSLTFLNIIAQGDVSEKKKGNRDIVDCTPPSYILPGNKNIPISALQPQSKISKNPYALKILTTSGWNPPPGIRKLHGDLMYLYAVTLEDKRFHITSSTKGFYVNMTTDEEFNPKAQAPFVLCHSLIDLLSHLSPLFKKNFQIISKKRHQKHPFERVSTPYQVYSWIAPSLKHSLDSIRAEDSFSSKLGHEEHLPGQTRDWNDELQTTRELPRKSLPERLLRERAIFKIHSDFVVAATKGAMAVIDGNVLAINPSEDQKMQMFIWHNIFFSLGFDIKDHYKELGGDNAAFVAPNNDLQGVKAYTTIDVEGLYTLGTVVIDYRGFRVTAQSIIPGILEKEQEQSVVYGSIDFGKTIISNDKYLELLKEAGKELYISPHKVINHEDQLIELCSSVECKGIIGNDGRYYILDLLRTFPQDVNYFPLPIEEYSKKVVEMGYPKKFKHNLCCLRQELIDSFYNHRLVMYNQKVLQSFKNKFDKIKLEKEAIKAENLDTKVPNKQKALENGDKTDEKTKASDENNLDEEKNLDLSLIKFVEKLSSDQSSLTPEEMKIREDASKAVGSLKNDNFDISFNPNAFLNLKHDPNDLEKLNKEKQIIKDAADFLLTNQIPVFINDCLEMIIYPFDGFELCQVLHSRGINIRYLGKVTEQLSEHKTLAYLHSISITELICRSAKHLFIIYLQNVDTVNLASAISLFLNCFLSACKNVSVFDIVEPSHNKLTSKKKNRKRNKHHVSTNNDLFEWASLTPKLFLEKLKEDLSSHYSYNLKGATTEEIFNEFNINKVSVLRSFCLKTGIQLLLQDYKFDDENSPTFNEDDILNIFPVVKHIQPKATDAWRFYTTGQAKIHQGQIKECYELINESLNLLNNVYGAMHPEIIRCLRMLARLSYIMGDFVEAMSCQQKAVLMSEKVNGIDHSNKLSSFLRSIQGFKAISQNSNN
ncbi:hypothetical protein RND71_044241 [Anisodus tanguticus]|uniref:Clu domain-containing protein n=1 Tax=Anisodus tanguticus TaxID=243964 RepID=A0AAE1QNA4_9SOLA|nr:hypothetical protein RND71_044241 [Anisodus tanguticus]